MATERMITVLRIDGAGIEGIIPATMIAFLEPKRQELDGPDARIADCFDVIVGTIIGAMITTVLVALNNDNRPLYTARDITPFYLEESFKIFNQHEINNYEPNSNRCQWNQSEI